MELKVSAEKSRQPFKGTEKLSLERMRSIGSSVLMVKRSHETRQSIPLSPRTA